MSGSTIVLLIILCPIIIFLFLRLRYVSKYSIFLEDEYYNLINLLKKSSSEEREQLLEKAAKTSLYKKIRNSNSTSLERFIDMHNQK